jgi:hypothetical protein
MINITQPNPVVWSPPANGAAAPVAAVNAIRPLQESARSGQQGAERELPSQRADRGAADRDAKRAARETGADGLRSGAGRAAGDRGEPPDAVARREAEQAARQQAADQANEETRRAQRQELLTNVWKASAAVVERVLGREEGAAVDAAAVASPAAPGRQPAEQLTLPWPVMPQDPGQAQGRRDFPAPQDVVAYDERGNSNLAPLEAGALLSRRV